MWISADAFDIYSLSRLYTINPWHRNIYSELIKENTQRLKKVADTNVDIALWRH